MYKRTSNGSIHIVSKNRRRAKIKVKNKENIYLLDLVSHYGLRHCLRGLLSVHRSVYPLALFDVWKDIVGR